MQAFDYELIFVGGGLASGLAATLLRLERPETRFLLIDAGRGDDWDQTWSFQVLNFDKSRTGVFRSPRDSWIAPFLTAYWDSYSVQFPQFQRTINSPYVSIRYRQFVGVLQELLGEAYRPGVKVSQISPTEIVLEDGSRLRAQAVIDGRGWHDSPQNLVSGYQKFLGLQLKTERKHGVTRPIVMDACLPQDDGFRFMYVLPWSDHSLLVEDTHYSRGSEVDRELYRAEILHYAKEQNWGPLSIEGEEFGSLPLPCYGEEARDFSQLPELGVRGRFYHPTTGYSIYEAVHVAEWLATQSRWDVEELRRGLRALSDERWKELEFFRRLNNMLFFAASDGDRYKVLEKFYGHHEDLVARFYAGQTLARDKLRILSGKPPVPVKQGIYHFFHKVGENYGTP